MTFAVIWTLTYYLAGLYTEPSVLSLTKACPTVKSAIPPIRAHWGMLKPNQKLMVFTVNLLIYSDSCVFASWNYWFLLQFILLHKKVFVFLLREHLFTVSILHLSLHFDKLSRTSSVGVLVRQILPLRNIFCASYITPMKLLSWLWDFCDHSVCPTPSHSFPHILLYLRLV